LGPLVKLALSPLAQTYINVTAKNTFDKSISVGWRNNAGVWGSGRSDAAAILKLFSKTKNACLGSKTHFYMAD